MKDGYIAEALLGNTNSNNWGRGGEGIHYSFNKYCISTVTKLVLKECDHMKECDRCHDWFHKACENFNC